MVSCWTPALQQQGTDAVPGKEADAQDRFGGREATPSTRFCRRDLLLGDPTRFVFTRGVLAAHVVCYNGLQKVPLSPK